MRKKQTLLPVAIACDHRGVALKERIKRWLLAEGHTVTDLGTDDPERRVDAMDYAVALAAEIRHRRSDFAVGICGSGQMMAITANRFGFMRAVLLHTASEAAGAREHGDANMLALGADGLSGEAAEQILAVFLTTAPLGERYAERRAKLAALDVSAI